MRATIAAARSWPAIRRSLLIRDLLLITAGSLVVGLGAQVAVYLPFTPVPISGQTFGVLLVGALLGSRRGAASLLLYLAQGAAGLPVFAGGMAGLAVLLGPRGGYLVGMVLAAYVVGWLAERGWDRDVLRAAGAMVAGNVAIYAVALPWLALMLGAQVSTALALGLYPFLLGDAVKIALAAGGLPVAWGLLGRLRG